MEIERNLNSYAQMVRWFSPHLLVLAAYRDTVARIFGEFADQRGMQHVADPIPTDEELKKKFCNRYDYSGQAGGSAPYWVDFAADLGDGFDSTYSVAYMLAADKLYPEQARTTGGIRGIKGLAGSEPLEHGRLLILSGDEVYPWPTHEDYELKTFKPYAMALPEPPVDPQTRGLPPASRHVFVVPGNHDWYDGLSSFDYMFCKARFGHAGGEPHRRLAVPAAPQLLRDPAAAQLVDLGRRHPARAVSRRRPGALLRGRRRGDEAASDGGAEAHPVHGRAELELRQGREAAGRGQPQQPSPRSPPTRARASRRHRRRSASLQPLHGPRAPARTSSPPAAAGAYIHGTYHLRRASTSNGSARRSSSGSTAS